MKSKSLTWTLLGALTAFCLGISEAQATVTPYVVDPSGFSDYALISDLSKGGDTNINNKSTINGNAGVVGGNLSNSNNSTINGDLDYTNSNFALSSSMTVTGVKSMDVSLATASTAAALFSQTIANFTPNQILANDLNQGATITKTGDLNVINITGNNVNGTVTLNGDSNDVFYINVSSNNLNLSKVVLNGVDAKNVYWNIIGGGNVNLSGTLAGTILSYSSSQSITINNATIEGNIYATGIHMNNTTVNGVSLTEALENEAMAPEASSVYAIGIFGAFLFGSYLKRIFFRRSGGLREVLQAA